MIESVIRAWQRTTSSKTDIADEDWTTLFAMCKKAELDAMREGMRRAAIIAEGETFSAGKRTDWEIAYDKGCKDCESSILSAAEQLTEKDLTQ